MSSGAQITSVIDLLTHPPLLPRRCTNVTSSSSSSSSQSVTPRRNAPIVPMRSYSDPTARAPSIVSAASMYVPPSTLLATPASQSPFLSPTRPPQPSHVQVAVAATTTTSVKREAKTPIKGRNNNRSNSSPSILSSPPSSSDVMLLCDDDDVQVTSCKPVRPLQRFIKCVSSKTRPLCSFFVCTNCPIV
jgi:hypothetical protein